MLGGAHPLWSHPRHKSSIFLCPSLPRVVTPPSSGSKRKQFSECNGWQNGHINLTLRPCPLRSAPWNTRKRSVNRSCHSAPWRAIWLCRIDASALEEYRLISNHERERYRSMDKLLFWLGIGAAQKGAGTNKRTDSRHWVISFVVGILIALLIGVGTFLLLVSQQ
jgi:hypothetical protein